MSLQHMHKTRVDLSHHDDCCKKERNDANRIIILQKKYSDSPEYICNKYGLKK